MTGNNHDQPLRVLYFGTYRSEYSRNRIMIEGLRCNHVEVIECHEELWQGIQDRVNLTLGGWFSPKFWWRMLSTYYKLIIKFLKIQGYDIIIVGYPGQFDIFIAFLLNFFQQKPICWDILMSIYLVAKERKLDHDASLTVNMLRWIEKLACTLADMMILESDEYVNWFVETHQADKKKFWLVPLGAQESRLQSLNNNNPLILNYKNCDFLILYWGGFLSSHGIDIMLGAARLLQADQRFVFEFVGDGPEREALIHQTRQQNFKNVYFPGWLEDEDLIQKIRQADICLGVFGSTPQSYMTIQNRIYECLALQKSFITGFSPIVARTFENGKHLILTEREPQALANTIKNSFENPEERKVIANNGYQFFLENFSTRKIGSLFKIGLSRLVI